MNIFEPEHQRSSPWDRQVARILSAATTDELEDPNEIEYFLSNDLDVLYKKELRSIGTSPRKFIEDSKRDLFLDDYGRYTKLRHMTNTSSLLTDTLFESFEHHREDLETIKTKRARIEPAVGDCKLLSDEDSFFRGTDSLKEDTTSVLFAQDSSSSSSKKFHCLVEEYQKGLDALTQCIKRTRETRFKVAMIKNVYMNQTNSEEFASNKRDFECSGMMVDDMIGKNIELMGNHLRQHTNSVSSLETEDSTESK